eukprot:EG_transcript_2025
MPKSSPDRVPFHPTSTFPDRLRAALGHDAPPHAPTTPRGDLHRTVHRGRVGAFHAARDAARFGGQRDPSGKPATYRDHPLKVLYDPDTSVDVFVQACVRWPNAQLRHLFRELGMEFKRLLFQLQASETFKKKGDFRTIVMGVKQAVHDEINCERTAILLADNGRRALHDPLGPGPPVPVLGTLLEAPLQECYPAQFSNMGPLVREEEALLGSAVHSLLVVPIPHARDSKMAAGLLATINRCALTTFQPKDLLCLTAIADCLAGPVNAHLQNVRTAHIRDTLLASLRQIWQQALCHHYYTQLRHFARLQARRRHAYNGCLGICKRRDTEMLQSHYNNLKDLLHSRWSVDRYTMPWAVALLTCPTDMYRFMDAIAQQAKQLCRADRSILFLLDEEKQELWSQVAEEGPEIRIPFGRGIAGAVALEGETINIADAYLDDRFNAGVDSKTGYVTRHILCVPLRDAAGGLVGVLQLINRLAGTPFTPLDERHLELLGHYAVGALATCQRLHDAETERRRWTHLSSALGPVILGLDPGGKLWFCNRPQDDIAQHMSEFVDLPYTQWYPEDINVQYIESITQCFSTVQALECHNFPLMMPEGHSRRVNFRIAPAFDDLHVCEGLVVTLEARTEEDNLLATVGRYFSLEDTQRLIARGPQALGPQQRTASFLAVTLKYFLGSSDALPPTKLTQALDFVFNCVAEVIHGHRGVIASYTVDGMLCAFGFPNANLADASRSATAALRLREKLAQYKEAKLQPQMALHCGAATASFAGTSLRKEFVFFGPAVRLMTLLQRWAALYHVDILCTGVMNEALRGSIQVREVDTVLYNGQEIPLYEVLQVSTLAIARPLIVMHRWYAQGLQLYREQQWLPAVVKFQAALDAGDRAAGIMIRRCNRFLKHPPPAGWKGCWDFSDKPQPDAPPGASDRPAS